MTNQPAQVIVAGHLCLDMYPGLDAQAGNIQELLSPGNLVVVDQATLSTGGTVSNTGLALHRLGIGVHLMGKIGRDLFGKGILEILRGYGPELTEDIIVSDDASSYSIVISPPGVDRIFLHCPGANDTFGADDIDYNRLSSCRLFHFGYPPLMRKMYLHGGAELERLFRRARDTGVTTSLDMALVDPASQAGQVDWPALLGRILPFVDVFLPSFDEILFMLDRERLRQMQSAGRGNVISQVNAELLADISGQLIDKGVAIVALKLGDQGMYLRTTAQADRLRSAGRCAPPDIESWAGRELLVPCFEVDVAGTTGSGDCTIAGFLAAMILNRSPQEALVSAVGAGACNVEAHDSLGGILPWQQVQSRIAAGWARRPVSIPLPGWGRHADSGVFVGPNDSRA